MSGLESDPEFLQLRDEFIESLQARRQALPQALAAIRSGATADALRGISHKLAGAAAPYGFQFLGEVAGALDDVISGKRAPRPAELLRWGELLSEMLTEALSTRQDPVGFSGDPRLIELTSAAGSALSEENS